MTNYNSLPLILFCITLFFFTGCREQTGRKVEEQPQYGSGLIDPAEKAFFNNLAQYCGQSFRGEQAFMAEGRESWAHMEFMMHVTVCEESLTIPPACINSHAYIGNPARFTWSDKLSSFKLSIR